MVTTEDMATTIETARQAGWGEGTPAAGLLDDIVAAFRAAQAHQVPAPGVDEEALVVLLAGSAAAWLRQGQPCHLCDAPAGKACKPSCLAAQHGRPAAQPVPAAWPMDDQAVVFHDAQLAWCPAIEELPYSDLYVLKVLGLRITVRRREDSTHVDIDTDEAAGALLMPLTVEVNNGGETTYGEGTSGKAGQR